jgi:hemerythrin
MLIDKNNMPIVAMDFMNDVHSEDIDIINQLFELVLKYESDPTSENKIALNEKYNEWVEHTVAHFKREEDMMVEKKFPPYFAHKGEHDNALSQMRNVFNEWQDQDDIKILKTYLIETLPQWLSNHIQTMDTVTAMFFKTGMSPCSMH